MNIVARKERVKRDKSSYRELWENVIEPRMEKFLENNAIQRRKRAKHDIWVAYKAFNKHVSKNYMRDAEARLDRHKVAACYMCAIIAAMPFDVSRVPKGDKDNQLANERLAMQVSCDILASFITAAIIGSNELDDEETRAALERVKKGVAFPDQVGHGTYVDNFLECLSFTQVEAAYNLLLLAELMFHWEMWMMDDRSQKAVIKFYSSKQSSTDFDIAFREYLSKKPIYLDKDI